MHVDLIRKRGIKPPLLANPGAVTSMRVWHCHYATYSWLEECTNLRELMVGTFVGEDLTSVSKLSHLSYLKIVHVPELSSLKGLSKLEHLTTLSLSTAPSWEVKGRLAVVESLLPISELPKLKHLELFGVGEREMKLEPLFRCPELRTARFAQYSPQEQAKFFKQLGVVEAYNPPASFE